MESIVTPLLSFVLVIALIPAALWLLRRTPMGIAAQGNQYLRTVSTMTLSNTQRIVTVEVGTGEDRQWLVLGVTPQSITTLHQMPPQAEAPAAPAAVPAFGDLLARLRGTPTSPKDIGGGR